MCILSLGIFVLTLSASICNIKYFQNSTPIMNCFFETLFDSYHIHQHQKEPLYNFAVVY